jgi:ACS family glucarate transporter-like MFS transporter
MNLAAAATGRPGNTRWRYFALLAAMAFLSYLLRQDIQVAGQFMMPELGISEIEMGWIYAAFPLGYAIAQLPGGLLGERFGARRVLTALGISWLLTSAATGFLPGLFTGVTVGFAGVQVSAVIGLLVLIRFAVGVVHAPIFPVQAGAIATWFPVGRWGLPQAISSAGLTLGAAATQPLVMQAVQSWGWQSAFYVFIPFGVLLFSAWWLYARDDPADHPGVGAAELALINHRRDELHAAPAEERGAWLRLLRNRETLLLTAAYFSMNVVFYLFFTWFLHYLVKVRGFSVLAEGTGYLAAMPWLTGTFTAMLGGWCCDALCTRLGPRWGCSIPGAGGLFATALFLTAGLHVDDPYMAVALMSLCFASTQFTEASFWQAQTFVASTHAASATGIMNTGANFAGIIVGPLIPWLALERGWGWVGALSLGVFFALLGAFLWLLVRADRPLPESEDSRPA